MVLKVCWRHVFASAFRKFSQRCAVHLEHPSKMNTSSGRRFGQFQFYQLHRAYFKKAHGEEKPRCWDPKVLFAVTAAAGFSFHEHGISDERYERGVKAREEFDDETDCNEHSGKPGWEYLVKEKDFRALRRRIDRPDLGYDTYEYKCAGTYYDISPRSFLDAQNNIAYRRQWDANIVTLELLKEEDEHELIRWVSKYPYPLYAREYIYVRRTWVSEDRKVVVVESEVVPETVYPSSPGSPNVRVGSYTSRMAIRAHKSWEDHGVDYILTYADNPEANIPRYLYNWLVNLGGPHFLKQVHAAAIQLEKSGRHLQSTMDKAFLFKWKRESYSSTDEASEQIGIVSKHTVSDDRKSRIQHVVGVAPQIEGLKTENISQAECDLNSSNYA